MTVFARECHEASIMVVIVFLVTKGTFVALEDDKTSISRR